MPDRKGVLGYHHGMTGIAIDNGIRVPERMIDGFKDENGQPALQDGSYSSQA